MTEAFSPYSFLNSKRRGEALPPEAIREFIVQFTEGKIADYQMSAFLMTVAIHGLGAGELAALTRAMLESGEQWAMRDRYDFLADKHSTGGVGDKVSLALAPWVAACGIKVGMLSGRGLGHTGGTLDKLDAVPGFNARLSRHDFERVIDEAGCVIATSTEGVAPADRRMYALRDVTGTVESLPLITASIMSKKLALGPSGLVLDVKTGNGAFMRELVQSRALAQSLILAAAGSGTVIEALITDMNQPLGATAGNANEVIEAFALLRGEGPDDLREVTRAQALSILLMSGVYDVNGAGKVLDETITSGAAAAKAREWLSAQGADPIFFDEPHRLPQPLRTIEVKAPRSGFISSFDTVGVGMLVVDLGAGRKTHDDVIDYSAGIRFDRKLGAEVRAGDVIARIELGKKQDIADAAVARYLRLVEIADEPSEPRPLIHEHVKAGTAE